MSRILFRCPDRHCAPSQPLQTFRGRYALVMLDKLRLNVVKREVDVAGFLALSFDLVGFGVPHVHRYGMPATELRLASIDCDPPHDRDNTVFLLASVHEEQDFECCSYMPCFLPILKRYEKYDINH